jgi:hypothetical protein
VLVETEPLLHRCIPTSGAISDVFDAINADGTFTTVLNDLSETWQEMLYLCLVAVGTPFAQDGDGDGVTWMSRHANESWRASASGES